MTLEKALGRYLEEVTPTKKASTQKAEQTKAAALIRHLGKYSLAALSADVIAEYRDKRLKETVRTKYKEGSDVAPKTVSANTVRLELASTQQPLHGCHPRVANRTPPKSRTEYP